MNAFSAAIDAIFADPHVAADATWLPQAGGSLAIRVILRRPDDVRDFAGGRLVSDTVLADLRVGDVALPVPGDAITIGTDSYVVQGDPQRDAERLVWTVELVPQ